MGNSVAILAPAGRDAEVLVNILRSAGVSSSAYPRMDGLLAAISAGEAGAAILTEESLAGGEVARMEEWLARQPPWSDLPIILLTSRSRTSKSQSLLADRLGNVTIFERPLHPVTLAFSARAALRARARQHRAEAYVEELNGERQALRESEARYRTLFDSIDEGFCVIEFLDGPQGPFSDYVHVSANPAYERHAGISSVVGQKVRDMVPNEADGWIRLYRAVLLTGEPIRFERELVATHRILELSAFRIEPADKRQVAVLFQDITARKRAEEQLLVLNRTLERRIEEAISERRLLADIVDGTDAFVLVIDTEQRLLAINQAAKLELKRVLGIQPVLGRSLMDVLSGHPAALEQARSSWPRVLAGEAFTELVDFDAPDGTRRSYEIKFYPLRDSSGGVVGAYQFGTDVTERLRDQAKLADATARMHEMAKIETIGQLTGGVAHDFNNLLTPIVGTLDILGRRLAADDRSAKLIAGAMQAADRAAVLVQRLLAFARRQALQSVPIDVGGLVENMRDLVQRAIGTHIEVDIRIEPGLPAAQVDPNQLELAILNLAVNARDAMGDSGRLSIEVTACDGDARLDSLRLAAGRYVRMAVTDTGTGMDEATLKRSVEPFYTTKSQGKGTGLGLSMVHGLAAQSGGALKLDSVVGRGTTAQLWLPVSEGKASAIVPVGESVAEQQDPVSILLVDDEELVRRATAAMLRNLGHQVTEANSASAALGFLKAGVPADLLVTDYLMPHMRGSALVVEARRLRPGIKALLITGYANLEEGEATELPRLSKPFRESDLAREIARAVNGGDPAAHVQSNRGMAEYTPAVSAAK